MSERDNECWYEVTAPTRTADVGGWTDTWFAAAGAVCNVALGHRARVVIRIRSAPTDRIRLVVAMTGDDDVFDPDDPPGRHHIIEPMIVAMRPSGEVTVWIDDDIVAGSGLGTSASVMVALVAGLATAAGAPLEAGDVAQRAHRFEIATGKQSGVQDHWAAAFGGLNLFDVRYPDVVRTELSVPAVAAADLGARLHTVYFGRPHVSSELHDRVIERLEAGGGVGCLDVMRAAAVTAADALVAGDLDAYGRALTRSHDAMAALQRDLVGVHARGLVELARSVGARGWKANGAGGAGGSMAVLGPADAAADARLLALIDANGWACIPGDIGAAGVVVERVSPPTGRA